MQSETADFVPLPPPGELDETYASFVIPANSHHDVMKHDVIHKTRSIALPSEDDRVTAIGNVYRKFGEIWTSGQTDRETDRHTYKHVDRNNKMDDEHAAIAER